MKASVWVATLISMGALLACSGDDTGSGATGTTGTTGTTSSTSSGAGGSGGAGGGAGGSVNCAAEPDPGACVACETAKNPTGAAKFNALQDCIYCNECYNVCDGAATGCAAPPATMGTCDGAGPDATACGDASSGCIACAYAGACLQAANDCVGSPECLDYGSAVGNCGN